MDTISSYTPKNLHYFMKHYSEIEQLMIRSTYISSCNFSYNFFPVLFNIDQEIGMSMRVPLSSYLCLAERPSWGIVFEKAYTYDSFHQQIRIDDLSVYSEHLDSLGIYMQKYLQEHGCHDSYDIAIFMSRQRNAWFGYKSFWFSLMAYWLLVNTNQISDWQERNPEHKDKILNIVKEMYKIVSVTWFIRGTFLWPLWYKHAHPVYFNQKRIVNLYDHTQDALPVDIVIISFWTDYARNISLSSVDDFHAIMRNYVEKLQWKYDKEYLNQFAYCLKASFIEVYELLIANYTNVTYIQQLMQAIDRIVYFTSMIEGKNEMIDKINTFITQTKQFSDEYIGVIPMTSNQHADNMILIANKHKSRQSFDRVLSYISSLSQYSIEYVSWIDNDSIYGITINHRASRQCISKELQKYDCIVRDMQWWIKMMMYSDLHDLYKDYIIIDSITNKITGTDLWLIAQLLPSQTYTISVFAVLVKQINQRIPNNALEISAYSKSMNQFSWKILSPWKKLIKVMRWEVFPLYITGSLHEWTILLQKNDLRILFVEKK